MPTKTKGGYHVSIRDFALDGEPQSKPTGICVDNGLVRVWLHYTGIDNQAELALQLPGDAAVLRDLAKALGETAADIEAMRRGRAR